MIRTVTTASLFVISVVLGIAAPVVALQSAPDRAVVVKSDGSMFFIQGGVRYGITPVPLSDEEIDAIPLAPIAADLQLNPSPVQPGAMGPERVIVEPSDTVGLDLTRPIAPGVICHCSVDRRGRISVFEVSIDEVVRDAWPLVRQANRFNRAPDDSFGYMAAKISMAYLSGPSDDAFQVSGADFKLVGADRALRPAASIIEPEPRLSGSIYPGATVTGYVVYEVRKGEEAQVLLFETNFNGERGVWFALG